MGNRVEDGTARAGDEASTGARRPRRRPGENRERLVVAATSVFASFGYHGASTVSIAALADVPQPHVYTNFSTKLELFLSCWERVFSEILQSQDRQLPAHLATFLLQASAVAHSPDFAHTSLRSELREIRTSLGSEALGALLLSGFDHSTS